jgi:hypothetical protein
VDDDSRRLVDHEQMLVLVDDRERNLLRGQRLPLEESRVGLHRLAALQPVALRPLLPIDTDRTRGQQPLRGRTRADLGLEREEAVEPRSRGVLRNQ